MEIIRISESKTERTRYEFITSMRAGEKHLTVRLDRITREWRESPRHRTWMRRWQYVHYWSPSLRQTLLQSHEYPGVPDDVQQEVRRIVERGVQYDFGKN